MSRTQQATITDIVNSYCEEHGSNYVFSNALNVFESLHETFLQSDKYSEEIKQYSNHLAEIVREFQNTIAERKTAFSNRETTLTNLLQKSWYTENRFRVLDHVTSKPRYSFKQVDKPKAYQSALPPAPKK